jgi:hypothetical protein
MSMGDSEIADAKEIFMPCDEGRARATLKWVLVDGRGDNNFRQLQAQAQAGVATNNEVELLSAINEIEKDHDFGAYVACRESHMQSPGILIKWGHEILG